MKQSRHSSVRSQQRGIPSLVIDLLIEFGSRSYRDNGAEIVFFDRKSRKRVEKYTGGLIGKLNEHMDSYAVVSGNTVITVGTRYKKISN